MNLSIRPDNMLQFALGLCRRIPEPDSDQRGEDGPDDGCVLKSVMCTEISIVRES